MPLKDKAALRAYKHLHYVQHKRRYRKLSSAWKKNNPDKVKALRYRNWVAWLKCRYGITPQEFRQLYENQEGMCAICSRLLPFRGKGTTHIDHDHRTGRIRGILCNTCNRGIGYLQDSPTVCTHAAGYLKAFA